MVRKMFVLLLFVLMFSASSVMAQDLAIEVQGGYYFGDASTEVLGVTLSEEDVNGFWGTADVAITESIGVLANFNTVSGDTVDGNRFDIMGSYAIPGAKDFRLKALAGYSMTKLESPLETDKFKGFLVGAKGSFSPMDKLNLEGFFGFGLGMELTATVEGEGTATLDSDLTTYNLSGNYAISDNLSLVAGYRGEKYSINVGGADAANKVSGFFFGARTSF